MRRNYKNTTTEVLASKPSSEWTEKLDLGDIELYPFEFGRPNRDTKSTAKRWKSHPKLIVMQKGTTASLSLVKDGYTKAVFGMSGLPELAKKLNDFLKTDLYKKLLKIEADNESSTPTAKMTALEQQNTKLLKEIEELKAGKKTASDDIL